MPPKRASSAPPVVTSQKAKRIEKVVDNDSGDGFASLVNNLGHLSLDISSDPIYCVTSDSNVLNDCYDEYDRFYFSENAALVFADNSVARCVFPKERSVDQTVVCLLDLRDESYPRKSEEGYIDSIENSLEDYNDSGDPFEAWLKRQLEDRGFDGVLRQSTEREFSYFNLWKPIKLNLLTIDKHYEIIASTAASKERDLTYTPKPLS